MIGSLVLGLALAQIEVSPRLKATLPNGSGAFVERTLVAPGRMSLVLAATVGGAEESVHGARHLLEHLVVKGPDGKLDARLESVGLVLTASTTRDAMLIEISGPSAALPVALEAVQAIMGPFEATVAQIAREAEIIREERALVDNDQRLANAAWDGVFGAAGQDPFGDPDAISKITPESLTQLHSATFGSAGIAVTVVGDVNLEGTMRSVREMLGARIDGDPRPAPERDDQEPTERLTARGATGEARSVVVAGLDAGRTLATLAAALGIAAWIGDAGVVYNPSTWIGLVTLTHPDSGRLDALEKMSPADREDLFVTGYGMLRQWVAGLTTDPRQLARWRAVLMLQKPGFDADDLRVEAAGLSREQFEEALNRFASPEAVRVEGVR